MDKSVQGQGLADLRAAMAEGSEVLSAWITLPGPLVVEAFARGGFDALTFDAQHGLLDEASLRLGLERAALMGVPGLVRLPLGGLALAAQTLDWGASGVVMPMVQGAADAEALVAVTKYPPLGERSYGPHRAASLHGYADGPAYVAGARERTLAFAMIETRAALDDLDAILAVDGLDGVFVGPSDLSIALSGDGTLDRNGEAVGEALARVAAACRTAGKIPAVYGVTPEDLDTPRRHGFRYLCVGADVAVLASGAEALANAARPGGG